MGSDGSDGQVELMLNPQRAIYSLFVKLNLVISTPEWYVYLVAMVQ
jgi:hypothetical protein